ncbi:hypothetical protein Acr_14g0007600 [Actinidia rufa]|uniref:Uncharacterized protein n=1 Tax=Actinidia rufa TaxID=165716 RepID=A0A7J0FQY4_9ERIC|nr:hypothetical protein Acr_14g0007600 [Actinidia rufa]
MLWSSCHGSAIGKPHKFLEHLTFNSGWESSWCCIIRAWLLNSARYALKRLGRRIVYSQCQCRKSWAISSRVWKSPAARVRGALHLKLRMAVFPVLDHACTASELGPTNVADGSGVVVAAVRWLSHISMRARKARTLQE